MTNTLNPDALERVKLEYNTLMEEYKALKEEMNAAFDAGRQIVNYTFILTTALVGALAIIPELITQTNDATVLLVIPAIFYLLAWSTLHYKAWAMKLSNYIGKIIAPEIEKCLNKLPSIDPKVSDVLNWEREERGKMMKDYGVQYFPLAGAHFGSPLLGAVFSIATYFYVTRFSIPHIPNSTFEIPLLIINLICLLYSIRWGLKLGRSS